MRSRPRPSLFLFGVLALSLPFVLLNFAGLPDPFGLPPSALMIVVPALLAVVMVRRESGAHAANTLLRPFLPVGSRTWFGVALVLVPLLLCASYAVSSLLGLEPEQGSSATPLTPVLLALYLGGAVLEELGWTMYATPRLQARLGVLRAGLAIGVTWEVWHVLPFITQGRSTSWILGQVAAGIALRILMGYVFQRTGASLLPAVLMHTAMNTVPHLLPQGFAGYHPEVLAVLCWGAVVVVAGNAERRTRRGTAFAG